MDNMIHVDKKTITFNPTNGTPFNLIERIYTLPNGEKIRANDKIDSTGQLSWMLQFPDSKPMIVSCIFDIPPDRKAVKVALPGVKDIIPIPATPTLSAPPVTELNSSPKPAPLIYLEEKVLQSKLISRIEPEYPAIALHAHIEGVVIIELTISEMGQVSNARIISGHPLLRNAAINTVKKWVYSPTKLNGKPVSIIGKVKVNFSLIDGEN